MSASQRQKLSKWVWFALGLFGFAIAASVFDEREKTAQRSAAERRAAMPAEPPVSQFLPPTPAPYDQQPKIAAEFGREVSDAILSASGYPIIRTNEDIPACTTPWIAKEATEPWTLNDRRWLDSMKDCLILPANTEAEWFRATTPPDATVLRFATRSGSRLTLYAPDTSLLIQRKAFGTLSLSRTREQFRQREEALTKR